MVINNSHYRVSGWTNYTEGEIVAIFISLKVKGVDWIPRFLCWYSVVRWYLIPLIVWVIDLIDIAIVTSL